MIKHLARIIVIAVTLPLVSAATRADGGAFIGSWVGTWAKGPKIELTVNEVDADGFVKGLYCNLRQSGTWFVDLRRKGGHVAPRVKNDVLSFKIGKTRWQFRPGESPDELGLTHKRTGQKKNLLTLDRTDNPGCYNRIVPLP